MEMKITLISPTTMVSCSPPLGIAYVAAVLRKNGYNVNIIDGNIIKNENEMKSLIRKNKPDVVGITMMTQSVPESEKIAKIVKELNQNTTIIVGGPHPTIMPKEILKNKNIDIAAIGEGEYTFLELIRSIENKKPVNKVKGIYYKINRKIKKTIPRKPIENLDELPFPARDLLPMEYYLSNIPQYPFIVPVTHLTVVRGCPFNCSFCQPTGKKLFGTKVRYRSPDNVIDEMEFLIEKYKLRSINLNGDTLTADKKWIYSFCDKLKKRKIDIKWNLGTRVNTVTRDMLKKMGSVGCYFIQFGVESGSQRILDDVMHKGITVKQTKDCFKWCNEAGIIGSANIMIGSPSETRYDIYLTYKLLKEIDPGFISAYITNPIPGTHLYSIAKSKKWVNTNDFSKLNRHGKGTMKRELEDAEIEKYIKLFWALYEQKLIKNTLQIHKNGHFAKYSFKREASLLKQNPLYFTKNTILKPMTAIALIKYYIFKHPQIMKTLMNHDDPTPSNPRLN